MRPERPSAIGLSSEIHLECFRVQNSGMSRIVGILVMKLGGVKDANGCFSGDEGTIDNLHSDSWVR